MIKFSIFRYDCKIFIAMHYRVTSKRSHEGDNVSHVTGEFFDRGHFCGEGDITLICVQASEKSLNEKKVRSAYT